ncbi:MAG: hypothetical protein H6542_01650 [Lentimicrobiaceae bacterium]|nr:hypothetical protein [Lentimicrobiaceae bacterium]
MMILNAILLLAVLSAIYHTIVTRKLYPAIVTTGMAASVLITVFIPKSFGFSGFYVYLIFVALAFIYGLTVKRKPIFERTIICLMAATIFLYWLWIFNHWHGNSVLAAVVTLLVALTGILGKAKLKNEAGFLLILVADAIVILIENYLKLQ